MISPPDFRRCLAASLALHASFFLLGKIDWSWLGNRTIEIDLTSTVIGIGGPARRATPKLKIPDAKGIAAPVAEPVPPQATPEKPQDFTTGKAKTVAPPVQEIVPVTPGGEVNQHGTSHLEGGEGGRDDFGEIDGTYEGGRPAGFIDPVLLNRDEVLRNLRKFYPERERIAGNEGEVVVYIHLDAEGTIGEISVFASAGKLFDNAATQVAKLMKFSPARMSSGKPVRVKIRRRMKFSLTDE